MSNNLVNADYSALEARTMAAEGVVVEADAFIDLHRKRAAEAYGCDIKDVSPTMRKRGKFLNYLELYGGSTNV